MAGNRSDRCWQAALVERYPDLFKLKIDGRLLVPAYPEVADGWQDVVERTVDRIAAAVSGIPSGTVRLVQIKQKRATLRVYCCGGPGFTEAIRNAVEDAIDLGEARSACTCELCGQPGRLFDFYGWKSTACDIHAKGQPAARPGMEYIHVQQKFVNGEFRTVRCRRYIRETDSFVDVESNPSLRTPLLRSSGTQLPQPDFHQGGFIQAVIRSMCRQNFDRPLNPRTGLGTGITERKLNILLPFYYPTPW